MKKLTALFLVLLLVLSATAALSNDIDLASMTDEQLTNLQADIARELAARAPETAAAAGDVSGTLGDYTVTIKGARLTTDYQDRPCIAVTFEWSHSKEDSESFLMSVSTKAFQGGIELETAIRAKDVDSSAGMLEIRSGVVLTVEKAFVLRDGVSPVEIEATELFSFTSKEKLVKTFMLSQ